MTKPFPKICGTDMERHIINPVVAEYLNACYRPLNDKLKALRAVGEEGHVPIILPETEMLLKSLLQLKKPEKILEIGTAIGYSAIFFAELLPDARIFTVEKDEYALNAARQNVETAGLTSRITVFSGDGQEQVEKLRDRGEKDFDFVFIDAAKSHYRRFLDAALTICRPEALVVSDNILQRGMTASDEYDEKGKHKTNIKKMREYVQFITNCPYLSTSVLSTGDGTAVSIYKG